jgi:hypothetical protein
MQPVIIYPLVMTNSLLLKMAIYSGFTHWKWSLSIVMLVYQRVLLWSAFANSRNRTQWRDVVSCGFPKTDGFSLGAVLQVVHRSPTQSWSVSGINIKYGYWLVVLTILKNISQWEGLSPYIMENKTCLKPPTRINMDKWWTHLSNPENHVKI